MKFSDYREVDPEEVQRQLGADDKAKLDAFIAAANAGLAEADSLAKGGNQLSIDNAANTRKLLDAIKGHVDRIKKRGTVSIRELIDFGPSVNAATSNMGSKSAVYQASWSAFYDQVVAKTGRDIASGLSFGLPLIAVGIIGFMLLRRRK